VVSATTGSFTSTNSDMGGGGGGVQFGAHCPILKARVYKRERDPAECWFYFTAAEWGWGWTLSTYTMARNPTSSLLDTLNETGNRNILLVEGVPLCMWVHTNFIGTGYPPGHDRNLTRIT
jgi:hypothetical protein